MTGGMLPQQVDTLDVIDLATRAENRSQSGDRASRRRPMSMKRLISVFWAKQKA